MTSLSSAIFVYVNNAVTCEWKHDFDWSNFQTGIQSKASICMLDNFFYLFLLIYDLIQTL